MKQALETLLYYLIGVYITVSMLGLLLGLLNSLSPDTGVRCNTTKRIAKIVPTYSLGCWLGEEVEK